MPSQASTQQRQRTAMPRTGPQPADTRDQIRAVAADLFFEKGYESTTMRDIAAILDIKAASLYYHFPDKEQILFELIDSVVNQLLAGARHAVQQERTAELKLAGLVVNHVALHALRPRESTLGDTELRSLTGDRRDGNVKHRDDYEQLVLRVLRAGERGRRFKLRDPKLTAYALIAQGSHVGTWFRDRGRLSLPDIAAVHVELAMRMVAAGAVNRNDIDRLVADVEGFHSEYAAEL
jgi:AcrR family transcriptional regulator